MSHIATHLTAALVAVVIATATIIPVVSVPQTTQFAALSAPVLA